MIAAPHMIPLCAMSRLRRVLASSFLPYLPLNSSRSVNFHRGIHSKAVIPTLIPEGWPRGVADRFSQLQLPTLIERNVFLDLSRDVITPLTEGAGTGRFVLIDGVRGVGKSAVLLQAVEQARKSGVLVLYIPRAHEWVHGDGFFSPSYENDDLETKIVRWYDRPKQTGQLMTAFWNAHRDILEELPIKTDIKELDGTALNNLGDIVRLCSQIIKGLDSDWKTGPRRAGDAFAALIRELVEVQEVPVAIAIDEFESMLGMTCMDNGRGRVLHSHGIRVVAQHFGQAAALDLARSLKRGIFLAALSTRSPRIHCRRNRILSCRGFPAPDTILDDPHGMKWLASVRQNATEANYTGSIYMLQVPQFDREEAGKVLSEFQKSNIRKVDNERLDRLRVLSGGRADILHRLCLTV